VFDQPRGREPRPRLLEPGISKLKPVESLAESRFQSDGDSVACFLPDRSSHICLDGQHRRRFRSVVAAAIVTRVPPETHYAKSGDVNIAYQVVGEGSLDLVLVHGWVQSFDAGWEIEPIKRFYLRLASFSRLILFDKRGTGLSDRVAPDDLPTLETRMDDMRAVMDEVGAERAAVLGHSEGGAMCALFAATYPERTQALVMAGSAARTRWAPDYPLGATDDVLEEFERSILEGWGVDLIRSLLQELGPSPTTRSSFRRARGPLFVPRALPPLRR
jgi:pimeloyl-ACP methyl ester carboxylesterase